MNLATIILKTGDCENSRQRWRENAELGDLGGLSHNPMFQADIRGRLVQNRQPQLTDDAEGVKLISSSETSG